MQYACVKYRSLCVAGSKAPSGGTRQCADDVQHCTVSRSNATHCCL